MFEGTKYDTDLSTIDGVWNDPLPAFSNLVVIDIEITSAIYWLIPILTACCDNLFLRRVIIRDVDDLALTSWDFPAKKVDLLLSDLPLVQVILVYPPEQYAKYIMNAMPLTMHFKRLHSLVPGKVAFSLFYLRLNFFLAEEADDDWMDYQFDPKEDPFGPDSIFAKIKEVKLVLPEIRTKEQKKGRLLKRAHTLESFV